MTVTLLHGDCLVRMAEIPDGSVDMILADLPYGTTACKWDNVIPFEPLWKHYWRVLKPNGAVVLFGSEPFSSHLRMSQIKHYKYDWIWIKKASTAPDFVQAKNKPIKITENVVVFSQGKTFHVGMTKNRMLYFPQGLLPFGKNVEGRITLKKLRTITSEAKKPKNFVQEWTNYPTNTLEFSESLSGRLHPTQKPVALLEYLIKTYTIEGETVLDNTMGSGSTGVACVNTGRRFIGIEQDDKYFAIAQQRIAEAQKPQELWK